MTTIAFDGKTLASDSQATSGGMVVSTREQKLFIGGDWLINGQKVLAFGLAGDCGVEHELFNVLSCDLDFMSEFSAHISFSALAVTGNDESYFLWKDKDSTRVVISRNYGHAAIGSGSTIAITAMHLGKTAAEAVKVATELDTLSGGSVNKVYFGWD